MNFECHITLVPKEDPEWLKIIEDHAERHKFKTSFITGDPLLGKMKYFYLTAHDTTYNGLKERMDHIVEGLPQLPIRLKIEQILFDKRQ